ncbi:hypothetical protein BBP40_006686 [Aspergillus hancockii]|nr:hypothetical protein BBP40_006686 [Aspergillus hancockii]
MFVTVVSTTPKILFVYFSAMARGAHFTTLALSHHLLSSVDKWQLASMAHLLLLNKPIVAACFGQLTPENSTNNPTSQGSFHLAGSDYLVHYTQDNGKFVRGHALGDVRNEIFGEDGTLRDSASSNVLGEDFGSQYL